MTWPPRGDDSFLQRSLRVAGWKVMKAYLSKCFEFGRYFFFFFSIFVVVMLQCYWVVFDLFCHFRSI